MTVPRAAVVRWLEEAGEDVETSARNGRPEVADLTVEELAEALELSPSTVRGWLPDVPGTYKLGGAWRISREGWRAYLDQLADEEEDEPTEVRSKPSSDLSEWREKRGTS